MNWRGRLAVESSNCGERDRLDQDALRLKSAASSIE
jgi:hypothetical protein